MQSRSMLLVMNPCVISQLIHQLSLAFLIARVLMGTGRLSPTAANEVIQAPASRLRFHSVGFLGQSLPAAEAEAQDTATLLQTALLE